MRRDGILQCGDDGWRWDANEIRRYIGHGTVLDLIFARIGKLPPETCALLETLACLGNSIEMSLLRAATSLGADALVSMLREPLEEGLLTPMLGTDARTTIGWRFRHDRVQQAAYSRLEPQQRGRAQLTLARRLANHPEFCLQAAEQYLLSADAVRDADERRQVARLFQHAAATARKAVSYAAVGRWLTEAKALLEGDDRADELLAWEIDVDLHAALYALGRLEDADRLFRHIAARDASPLELADAACVQISSLCNRNRLEEALALGIQMLQRLGAHVDEAPKSAAVTGFRELPPHADDVGRPEMTDPKAVASAKIINRLLPAALTMDSMDWMVRESRAMWIESGPCAELVGPLCHTGFVTVFHGDYRKGVRRRSPRPGSERGKGLFPSSRAGPVPVRLHRQSLV